MMIKAIIYGLLSVAVLAVMTKTIPLAAETGSAFTIILTAIAQSFVAIWCGVKSLDALIWAFIKKNYMDRDLS